MTFDAVLHSCQQNSRQAKGHLTVLAAASTPSNLMAIPSMTQQQSVPLGSGSFGNVWLVAHGSSVRDTHGPAKSVGGRPAALCQKTFFNTRGSFAPDHREGPEGDPSAC